MCFCMRILSPGTYFALLYNIRTIADLAKFRKCQNYTILMQRLTSVDCYWFLLAHTQFDSCNAPML